MPDYIWGEKNPKTHLKYKFHVVELKYLGAKEAEGDVLLALMPSSQGMLPGSSVKVNHCLQSAALRCQPLLLCQICPVWCLC